MGGGRVWGGGMGESVMVFLKKILSSFMLKS